MTIRMRVDQALGREEAYSVALRLIAEAETWAELRDVETEIRERLASATATIADLT